MLSSSPVEQQEEHQRQIHQALDVCYLKLQWPSPESTRHHNKDNEHIMTVATCLTSISIQTCVKIVWWWEQTMRQTKACISISLTWTIQQVVWWLLAHCCDAEIFMLMSTHAQCSDTHHYADECKNHDICMLLKRQSIRITKISWTTPPQECRK